MKTLILYASKTGTTEKAAILLKEQLEKTTTSVKLVHLKRNNMKKISLDQYNTVIIGGSIYLGKIQKIIQKFCTTNENTLLKKKLGLFLCCGSAEDFEKQLETSFNNPLIEHSTVIGYFGYGYNLNRLGFIKRLMIKKVANVTTSEIKLDTDAIEDFSQNIAH